MASQSSKLRFGLWYDFRNPPQWRQPYDRLYAGILDQIAWAEQNGFDDVWLSEHHCIEDGYLPSMLPAAAAIAARTGKIRIALGVLLMPFHNPVRLAEDIAVVDTISGGRFEFGVGTGYKIEEFEGFAVPFKERGGRTNEALEIIRRLLEGETLTFKGKFFEVNNVKITPEPIQKPRPPIWIGGSTPPAFRRAARYGDGYVAPGAFSPKFLDSYVAELGKLGKPTSGLRFAGGHAWLICSNDPEKTWNEAADHIIYQANNYAAWAAKSGQSANPVYIRDRAHLRETGRLTVVDPDSCVAMIRDFIGKIPFTHYFSWTLPPGLPPKWVQPHLELFASKVIPAFR
jgi:alkanesulfonate monooxygenase SsuD/methylene tetrahydromethanopterin reductase-like flavin-dependent oxidoreductase (luciferase family)